jgi:hypothetical protein
MTGTRPDIAYAVGQLSRFMEIPKMAHLRAAQRAFKYLKTTTTTGIGFTCGNFKTDEERRQSLRLEAFVDADWAGSIDDRKSTTGFVIHLAGGPICWKSTKQTLVALSSAEAEYIALTEVVKELMWLRELLRELGFDQSATPTVIYEDNQAAIAMSKNQATTGRTKHIQTRLHFVRDQVESGTVAIKYVATGKNVADALTKALPETSFKAAIPHLVQISGSVLRGRVGTGIRMSG